MKHKLTFFVTLALMLVVFVGFTTLIFGMSGWKFYAELVLMLGLLVFTIIGITLISEGMSSGYVMNAIISALLLFNLTIIFIRYGMTTTLFASLIASMTAFVISVMHVGGKNKSCAPCACNCNCHTSTEDVKNSNVEVYDLPASHNEVKVSDTVVVKTASKQAKKVAKKKKAKKTVKKTVKIVARKVAKKKAIKLNFVASTETGHYHDKRCTWADNIKPQNQKWFATTAAAEKAGYHKHKCTLKKK